MAVAWSTVDSGDVTLTNLGTVYEVIAPTEVINRLGHVSIGAQGDPGVCVYVYGSLNDSAWNGGAEYTLLESDTLDANGLASFSANTWRYITVRAQAYSAGDSVKAKMGWLPW